MNASTLGKVPALDGLRSIAIAGVFGLHVARPQFSGGFLGVDVFFTLSAFLITSLILDEFHERQGAYSFRGFYKRRALRLGPALLIWVVFLAVPLALMVGEGERVPQSILIVLTYTNDFLFFHLSGAFGHSWSLAVEEQFYLLWPLILVSICRRRSATSRRQILLAAVPIAVLVMIIGRVVRGDADYFWPSGHLVPLAVGCLAADLRKFGMPDRMRAALLRQDLPLVLGGLLAFLMIGFRFIGNVAVVVPVTVAAGFITAWLILHACVGGKGLAIQALSSRPARWMGKRSYAMYLYSLTILGLAEQALPGQQVRVWGVVTLAVSLPLIALSYRYVELPLVRLAHSSERRTPTASQANLVAARLVRDEQRHPGQVDG